MNRKDTCLFLMSVASLTVVAIPDSAFAFGARSSMDPMAMFEQADVNHDGLISRDEYYAARGVRFGKLDRNHDGELNDADFPRLTKRGGSRAEKLHELLQRIDVDHDGSVSRDEFVKAGEVVFNLVDVNDDGLIDKAELKQATDRLKALREQ
ncbi:MAG TPA: EF-hand domain-containing protein [Steroidobacteraceae bacterium]|jgi:Ca2+-binding EF-hand superfamily protein